MPPKGWRGLNRRSDDRPENPSCNLCGARSVQVPATIRTTYTVYFKCTKCGHVMTVEVPKPEGR